MKILGPKQVLWNTNRENSTETENSRAVASPQGEGGAEFNNSTEDCLHVAESWPYT